MEEGKGEERRVARSGGAKEEAVDPRPCRRMRVCLWGGPRGSINSASGYVEDFFLLLWEGVVEDDMVDWEVERCGVRELERCHISVSSLSSRVVGLLSVEMIGFRLDRVVRRAHSVPDPGMLDNVAGWRWSSVWLTLRRDVHPPYIIS